MSDNPELIELLTGELDIIIKKAHNAGLTYSHIQRILLERGILLIPQAEAEGWLNKTDKEK